MTRPLVVLLIAVGLTASAGPAAAAGKRLPAVRIPRPDPVTLLQLLDDLTRGPTAASTAARLRATFPQQKLQVAASRIEVSVRRSEPRWRGEVVVVVHLPTTARYTVDLSTLESRHLRYDPARRVLRVTMPPVQVESVSPDLSQLQVEHQYHGWRWWVFDRDTAAELERAALRDDYEPKAREAAAAQLPAVRTQGRTELQDLLQKCFQAAVRDLTVVVD